MEGKGTAKLELGVEGLQGHPTMEQYSPLLWFQSWWQWLPGAPGSLCPVPNTAWPLSLAPRGLGCHSCKVYQSLHQGEVLFM